MACCRRTVHSSRVRSERPNALAGDGFVRINMTMEIVRSVVVPGPSRRAFDFVDDLAVYPRWMDLVHGVVAADGEPGHPAWEVELRAQVGPFARSKRLRMVRTAHEPDHRVEFVRAEIDGRRHADWVLAVELRPAVADRSPIPEPVEVTMTLSYGGSLWAGAVLQRVLDDHVARGAEALVQLLASDG